MIRTALLNSRYAAGGSLTDARGGAEIAIENRLTGAEAAGPSGIAIDGQPAAPAMCGSAWKTTASRTLGRPLVLPYSSSAALDGDFGMGVPDILALTRSLRGSNIVLGKPDPYLCYRIARGSCLESAVPTWRESEQPALPAAVVPRH